MSNQRSSSDAELTLSEQISQTASIIFKAPESGTDLFVTGSALIVIVILLSYVKGFFRPK